MTPNGIVRLTCIEDISQNIRGKSKWYKSEPKSMSVYKKMTDHTPITYDSMYVCDIDCSSIQFLIRDVIILNDDMEIGGNYCNYFVSIIGRTCICNGTCMFHDRQCTFRVVCWNSSMTSHGIEIFMFDAHATHVCIGFVFFYLENDPTIIRYNPYIVNATASKDVCIQDACLEVLCGRRRKACNTIKRNFLNAKYNPAFMLCKKMLLHDMFAITIDTEKK
jgi:hypothetical protein